jgi:VanZ family protein
MEIAQLYVPGREASMADMIANLVGIALALVTLALRGRYTRTPARKA